MISRDMKSLNSQTSAPFEIDIKCELSTIIISLTIVLGTPERQQTSQSLSMTNDEVACHKGYSSKYFGKVSTTTSK